MKFASLFFALVILEFLNSERKKLFPPNCKDDYDEKIYGNCDKVESSWISYLRPEEDQINWLETLHWIHGILYDLKYWWKSMVYLGIFRLLILILGFGVDRPVWWIHPKTNKKLYFIKISTLVNHDVFKISWRENLNFPPKTLYCKDKYNEEINGYCKKCKGPN